MEIIERNQVETYDLSDRKNALLADHNLFISTGCVDPKEKNKKMKDRKKKKKVDLQQSRQSVLSCDTNSHIFRSQPAPQQHEYSGIEVENCMSNGTCGYFKRGSAKDGIHADIQLDLERQKLFESWSPRPLITFDLRFIVAPMVNQSDPPFRTLCLKYGATCAYTEMLYSHRIVNSENYLSKRLQEVDHSFFLGNDEGAPSSSSYCTGDNENGMKSFMQIDPNNDEESYRSIRDRSASIGQGDGDEPQPFKSYSSRPLIVQICGNDPDTLSMAVMKIKEYSKRCPVDAIDFNLGCPQDRAKEGIIQFNIIFAHHM